VGSTYRGTVDTTTQQESISRPRVERVFSVPLSTYDKLKAFIIINHDKLTSTLNYKHSLY
jgi:hypothetical protein